MGSDDRRKFRRAYIKLQVECRGKSTWQMIEATDISAGGMFVATDTVEPRDTNIEILFEFGLEQGKKQFVRAEGKVAWSRAKESKDEQGNILPAGMGVQFTKLNPLSSRDFIEEVIKKLEEKKDV